MKSKAHYKKCCELGINPNEGNDADNGEMAACSGESGEETDSDGDEGNEGETESSGNLTDSLHILNPNVFFLLMFINYVLIN